MSFYYSLTSFGGLAVMPWRAGDQPLDTFHQMPRIALSYDDERDWVEQLQQYLQLPGSAATQGIVIGCWSGEMYDAEPDAAIDALVAAAPSLPNLRVLFFGDITMEESEISWICNTDQSRLYAAYPNLTHLAIRGGNNLRLAGLALPHLTTLVIETGGMARETLADVLGAELPELRHLQLYLGDESYGADTTIADLAPLLRGELFPSLEYLGLQDCEYTDDIARALAGSPLLERISVLDLSQGTLTDAGAAALAAAPAARNLRWLNCSYHFMSDAGTAALAGLGIQVDVSDPQSLEDNDGHPYVAIGE